MVNRMSRASGRLAFVAVLLLFGLFATTSCQAKVVSGEDHSAQDPSPGEGSKMWAAEAVQGRMYFVLRDADLDQDFVVFAKTARSIQAHSWQLIRWRAETGKIVLLSVAGRAHELANDWTVYARRLAEFPALRSAAGTYRIDVTDLFHADFPAGWGMHAELPGSSRMPIALQHDPFELPKRFERNLVISGRIAAGEVHHDGRTLMQWSDGLARWNFVRLPERKMAPRPLHGRSAFMHPGFMQARPFNDIPDGQYEVALRWRLERAPATNPDAPVSPIVVYVDPNTPERWQSWVRRGIESWQKAFDAAGFSHAILAREAPPAESWDYDDLRYTTLCWQNKEICGWNIFDPRTGEVLQNQIGGTANALPSYLARYVVNMATLDPRVLDADFSDAFLGQFVRFIAAHEMGHLLGLKDGGYGGFSYSPEQVRDRDWVVNNGFNPSIMNYARFNFIAQPEDGLPVETLLQEIGPADAFWMTWGYSDSHSPEEMTRMWNSSDLHRYKRNNGSSMSPYDGFETPGVSDPVEGASLGLRNLESSMALIARHVFRDDDPEVTALVSARKLHEAAISQWRNIHWQVLTVIGTSLHSPALNSMGAAPGIDGHGTRPVDVELQARAVRFLCESAFGPVPEYLTSGVIADEANVSAEDVEDEIRGVRGRIFDHLAYAPRLQALPANWKTLKSGEGDFGAAEMLAELKPCVVR
jgi:hypothetical protein